MPAVYTPPVIGTNGNAGAFWYKNIPDALTDVLLVVI